MIKKVMLILVLGTLVFGGYVPVPAPVPMGDFVVYQNHQANGSFTIEDPNGPEGMTITVSPNDLVIGGPVITSIADDPAGEAKRYTYPWSYLPLSVGRHEYNITATDSLGVAANQKIVYTVKGNAPHVFTGCRMD